MYTWQRDAAAAGSSSVAGGGVACGGGGGGGGAGVGATCGGRLEVPADKSLADDAWRAVLHAAIQQRDQQNEGVSSSSDAAGVVAAAGGVRYAQLPTRWKGKDRHDDLSGDHRPPPRPAHLVRAVEPTPHTRDVLHHW